MLRATRSIALLAAIALALTGCTTTDPPRLGGPDFQVELSAAAHRLTGLNPVDAADQRRDWLRTALAAHLGLDTAALRDQSYDTLPVRDDGFTELARQPVGPGRALFAGDTLHVLAPDGDRRTAGLLLDQHRADAGADAPFVRLHHYTERGAAIDVDSTDPAPTAELRARLGYVEARVDSGQGLADFLGRVTALSTLEARGAEVWAGGWAWDGPKLTPEDVAVLHRAYTDDDRPGFSLDPSDPTVDGLRAAFPDLDPELAGGIISGDWAATDFGTLDSFISDVERALFNDRSSRRLARYGISDDRAELWALLNAAEGKPFSSHARYDGGLAGTEVGMTLFYTDHIAKDWVAGVGTGVPADAVPGFVPKPDLPTAWSHCGGVDDESGRLWFGQNDSAFTFHDGRVDIGAQATRLFARSDAEGGGEVERSYSFGAPLRWWDRHYQAVADYEPQYARLEQLMRWSAALEWLTTTTDHRLTLVPPDQVTTNLRYADWYAARGDLREREPLRIVEGADPEELLPKVSETYEDCGTTWIEGGVSLGDVLARKGDRAFRADLPPAASRAGLVDEGSTVDSAGRGRISNPVLDYRGDVAEVVVRDLSVGPDGAATVATTGGGRAVSPLGSLKVWLDKAVQRTVGTTLKAGGGRVEQAMTFHGRDLGGLTAVSDGRTVTVSWRSGLLDRARVALSDVQAKLVGDPRASPVPGAGVLYSHTSGGKTVHRVGDGDDPWLAITTELAAPADALTLRMGAPAPDGAPGYLHGVFTAGPGPPTGWLIVREGATAAFGDTPPPGPAIPVTTRDGRSGAVHRDGDGWATPVDDPVLGLAADAEGAALLRDMPRVEAAMADARDGQARAVVLGPDAVALAKSDGVQLLPPDDPWAARVLAAVGPDPKRVPVVQIVDDRLIHVAPESLADAGEPRSTTLGEALATDDAVYFHNQFRADLSRSEGPMPADALPLDATVTVREARAQDQWHTHPDGRTGYGATWWRVDGRVLRATGDQVVTTTQPPPSSAPAPADPPAPSARVLLICPEDAEDLAGCA